MLTACQQANFSPRLAYTPSLIGTVLSYVEAGAGIGILPESVVTAEVTLKFVPLRPVVSVPLVLVWQETEETPAILRLRELVTEWQRTGELWEP